MATIYGLDFETFSEVDLRKHGLDRYVNHPSFRVLLASVSHETDSTKRFDFITTTDPDRVVRQLRAKLAGQTIIAQNAGFERAVLAKLSIHPQVVLDSAVIARALGAASKLEAAAPQLVAADKMEEGGALIKLFSIPQSDGSIVVDEWQSWGQELWEQWYTFGDYCDLDAELSLEIHSEWSAWIPSLEWVNEQTTQAMNDIGWHVDLDLVREMQRVYQANLVKIEQRFRSMYDPKGELNFRSPIQLRKWCEARGVKVKSLDELHLAKYLKQVTKRREQLAAAHAAGKPAPKIGPTLEQCIEVEDMLLTKQELGGSSLSKLQTIIDMVGYDGRLRGQYLHVGAGQTYRTSGRGVQMQNLKRLGVVIDPVEELFAADKAFDDEWDNGRLARNLRQVFTAEHPDGELIVGDFSAVESRGLAYLAGEAWKLSGYRAGQDMYKVLASKMTGVPYDAVDKAGRQQGKVGELSCGYGAGPGAVSRFAEKMGMDLSEEEAGEVVRDWREANAQIVELWNELDHALHSVVEFGNQESSVDLGYDGLRLTVRKTQTPSSLKKQLPHTQSIELVVTQASGRYVLRRVFAGAYMDGKDVCYVKPSELKSGDLWRTHWTKDGARGRYKIYGGKLTGILTQSFCRELFFDSLRAVQAEFASVPNVKVIGQFHDEIVLEWTPSTHSRALSYSSTKALFADAMQAAPKYPSFPLAADVKSGHRYIK